MLQIHVEKVVLSNSFNVTRPAKVRRTPSLHDGLDTVFSFFDLWCHGLFAHKSMYLHYLASSVSRNMEHLAAGPHWEMLISGE